MYTDWKSKGVYTAYTASLSSTSFQSELPKTQWLSTLIPEGDEHLISFSNITPESHIQVTKIKGDRQLKTLLIAKQILLVNTLKNVWTTIWRIRKLIYGSLNVKLP